MKHFWILVTWACTSRASCSSKLNISKQHLIETLSLSSRHSFKSVPAGPRWGLTGPLLSSMNGVNCSLQWNTNKQKWLYIPQEKQVTVLVIRWTSKKITMTGCNLKCKYKACCLPKLNIKNDLKFTMYPESHYAYCYIKIKDLSVREWDFQGLWMTLDLL